MSTNQEQRDEHVWSLMAYRFKQIPVLAPAPRKAEPAPAPKETRLQRQARYNRERNGRQYARQLSYRAKRMQF